MGTVQLNEHGLAAQLQDLPKPPSNLPELKTALQTLIPDQFRTLDNSKLKTIARMVLGQTESASPQPTPAQYPVNLVATSVDKLLAENPQERQQWMEVPELDPSNPVYQEFMRAEDFEDFIQNHLKDAEKGIYPDQKTMEMSYLYFWHSGLQHLKRNHALPTQTHYLLARQGIGYIDGVAVVPSPRNFLARRERLWQQIGGPRVPELIVLKHPTRENETASFQIGETIPQRYFDEGYKVQIGVMPANFWSQYFPEFMPMSVDSVASHDLGHSSAYKLFPEAAKLLGQTVFGPTDAWRKRTQTISELLEVAGKSARDTLIELGKKIGLDIQNIFTADFHDQVQERLPTLDQLRTRIDQLDIEGQVHLAYVLERVWPQELVPFGGVPADINSATKPGVSFLPKIHPFWSSSTKQLGSHSIDELCHALRFAIAYSTLSVKDFLQQAYVPKVDPNSPVHFVCSQLPIQAGTFGGALLFDSSLEADASLYHINDIPAYHQSGFRVQPKTSYLNPWTVELPTDAIGSLHSHSIYSNHYTKNYIFELSNTEAFHLLARQIVEGSKARKEPINGPLLADWLLHSCTINGTRPTAADVDRVLQDLGLTRHLTAHEFTALQYFMKEYSFEYAIKAMAQQTASLDAQTAQTIADCRDILRDETARHYCNELLHIHTKQEPPSHSATS